MIRTELLKFLVFYVYTDMIFNKCISLVTKFTGIYFDILNINNQFDLYAICFIVIALASDGNWCYVNVSWLSLKNKTHLQGILTGECNLSLSCSTIVSVYRYQKSGNNSALEIWQTKPPAPNLLLVAKLFGISLPRLFGQSERCTSDFLRLPSFSVLSAARFLICMFFAWNSAPPCPFPLHLPFTWPRPTFSMKLSLTELVLV